MQVLQDECEIISELTGALDIHTVEEVRAMLLEQLRQNAHIVVDLSSVSSCDAAGAQLLLALEKSAAAANKSFSVLAMSEGFARDCANLGIVIASGTAKNVKSAVEGFDA
jgi:anti-anti-sigma factor